MATMLVGGAVTFGQAMNYWILLVIANYSLVLGLVSAHERGPLTMDTSFSTGKMAQVVMIAFLFLEVGLMMLPKFKTSA